MKKQLYLLGILWIFAVIACSKDDKVSPSITVSTPEEELVLGVKENSKLTIKFFSAFSWQASVNVDWVVISPNKGDGGNASISLLAKEENRTGEIRAAVVTLSSEGITKNIKFVQEASNIINVKQTTYEVLSEGQDVSIEFSTNIPDSQIKLMSLSDVSQWITLKKDDLTRALREGFFKLAILPNNSRSTRTAKFQIYAVDINNENNVLLKSPQITINQKEAPVGTSTDLITNDKKVKVLQKHSKGRGIPLVFMGDGFIDTDISNGYYQQVMEKALDNFFTEEPVKTLREYFDVWAVTAVSQNNSFEKQYNTKFNCELEGGGSTGISGNHEKVGIYAQAVPELANNPALFNETMAIVILNTDEYAGTTYFGFTTNGLTSEFAIGYCPIIESMESEKFRQVLCHECIGHGFAKLLDEYSYQEMGRIPTAEIDKDRKMQEQLGWAMNVDFTNDRSKVIWKHFLNDERYKEKDAFGESVGLYEGACTYWSGAYRPTNESMMRSNIHGFNAPSREAIYKRVMKTAYGSTWQYDYDEFVKFDQAHLPQPSEIQTRNASDSRFMKPFAAPRFVDRPLITE